MYINVHQLVVHLVGILLVLNFIAINYCSIKFLLDNLKYNEPFNIKLFCNKQFEDMLDLLNFV